MDDCGTGDSAPSADCSSAPDTSTHCSSSVDPPPDYSACVSHPETRSSNHHSGTTDTTQHSHHWHPISEDGASGSTAYNSQPSYNPYYMADRSTTPPPNVHGRKTIVLERTDAQNSARNRKLAIGVCLGLMIGAFFSILVFVLMAG